MASVPLFCMSVLLLCTVLFQYAECDKGYEYRSPKKQREEEQVPNYRFELDNVADSETRLDEEALWRQKIEAKKDRQKKLLAEKELRKKHEHRQGRSISSRTVEIRAPTTTAVPDPPPHDKVAEMARYIVHNAGWASVGYTNHHPGKEGLPMATLFSISDGYPNASTGTPYVYITPKDVAVQDLAKDNRCSFLISLAQTDYCKKKDFDPEDPRCAYVILMGKLKQLKNGTAEWNYASDIYFNSHPTMRAVPKGHAFRFAKLKVSGVCVQDYFGGMKFPTVKEYYGVKLNNTEVQNLS